jgi:hypothetical protein
MKKLVLAVIMATLVAAAGTAIAENEPTLPYIVVEAQIVGQDVIGVVPEGLRIDSHTRGVVTEGILAGATTTGIDYMLIRHDGVSVLDARWLAVHADGLTVAITLRGFSGEPTPGLLEAMLDPEFEFPDVDIPAHVAAWFHTMAPQYAFLNHTVFGCTGTVNMVEGVIRSTCRPLSP